MSAKSERTRGRSYGVAWLSIACATLLLGGCGQSQPISLPPSTGSDINLNPSSAADAPLTPDEVPVIAVETASTDSPGSGPMAAFFTAENRDLFENEEGRVVPQSGLEILQRAAAAYEQYRYTAADEDAAPRPPLTDLSLLVKYGLLRALPAAPSGQKFVVDSKTYKVSLVNQ